MSVPALPFLVTALYPYTSDHPDDLPFSEGEVIQVEAIEGDDWYSGSLVSAPGKHGMFPKNFVELRPEPEPPASEPQPEPVQTEVESAEPQPVEAAEPEPAEPKPVESKPAEPEPVAEEPIEPSEEMKKLSLTEDKQKPPKPAKSNAFRDRIAAFNTMNDAPPIPQLQQPKQRSFVNKPYVPPPSSYVPTAPKSPPPQSYKAPPAPPPVHEEPSEPAQAEEEEDVPKMSLKERIALLQKQQEEEQARAEAAAQRKKARADAKRKAHEEKAKDGIEDEERRLSIDKTGESVKSHRRSSSGAKRTSIDQGRRSSHEIPDEPGRRASHDIIEAGRRASHDIHEEVARRDSMAEEPEQGEPEVEQEIREPRKSVDERVIEDEAEEEEEEEQDEEDEDEEDESSEEDEEEAKRIALRERMAKISAGGMGMGMGMGMMMPGFGAPMAPSSAPKKKKKSKKKEEEAEEENDDEEPRQAPVPIMPFADPNALKHMGRKAEAEEEEEEAQEEAPRSPISERAPTSPISERAPPPPPPTAPSAPAPPPSVPSAPPVPSAPAAPPITTTQSKPSEQTSGRAPPPPPPSILQPPPAAPGLHPNESSSPTSERSPSIETSPSFEKPPTFEKSVPPLPPSVPVPPVPAPAEPKQANRLSLSGDRAPPPPPPQGAPSQPDAPYLPPIEKDAFDPFVANKSDDDTVESEFGDDERTESDLPNEPKPLTKRNSYVAGAPRPPIPNIGQQIRRTSTHYDTSPTVSEPRSLERAYTSPISPTIPPPPPPPPHPPMPNLQRRPEESEVTGYDADEDTDINPNVSVDEGYPPAPPHPPAFQPPLPPKEPIARQMPPAPPMRAPPPPVPSSYSVDGPLEGDEQTDTTEEETSLATARVASPPPTTAPPPPPPHPAQAPPQRSVTPSSRQSVDYSHNPSSLELSRTMSSRHRQSLDRNRMSLDGAGLSTAHEIDYAVESGWWTHANTPPPAVSHNARNLIFEVEDTKTPKRGGRTLVVRDVYILYHDLSQTILTARFEEHDPYNTVSFDQQHSQPPQENQDRLEDAYRRYGAKALDAAQKSLGQTLPEGEFVSQLVRSLEGAIPPIGNRSYGAVIYSNLSNASVKQWDEIRPGDIVTFRNAKFQGHKGGLHQKYSTEAGRSDAVHAGIVYEWDGTKRKVRVYEQNPDKNKIKQESYRLNDLKSGEVKAFRIIGREYVGWD